MNLLTHCALCGAPFARAYPKSLEHPVTARRLPCACTAEESRERRQAAADENIAATLKGAGFSVVEVCRV